MYYPKPPMILGDANKTTVNSVKMQVFNQPIGMTDVVNKKYFDEKIYGNFETISENNSTLTLGKTTLIGPSPPFRPTIGTVAKGEIIACDSRGFVYTYTNFDTTGITYNRDGTISGVQSSDKSLLKYSSDGTVIAKAFFNDPLTVSYLNVDIYDNLYVIGSVAGSTPQAIYCLNDVNTDTTSNFSIQTNGNSFNSYIVRYSPYGNADMYTALNTNLFASIVDIVTDSNGNIYASGRYSSNVPVPIRNFSYSNTLGESPFSLPATSGTIVYIIKWDTYGIAKSWTIMDSIYQLDIWLAINKDDNLHTLSYISSQSNVPSFQIHNFSTTDSYGSSPFSIAPSTKSYYTIIKFLSTGNAEMWTSTYFDYFTYVENILVDSLGYIYVVGDYGSTTGVDIYNFSTTDSLTVNTKFRLPSNDNGDKLYSVKYNPDGTPNSWTSVSSSNATIYPGFERIKSSKLDNYDNLYVVCEVYNNNALVGLNSFTDNVNLGDPVFTQPISINTNSGNILKFNSSGTLTNWVYFDGFSPITICLDNSSNIYITVNNSTQNVIIRDISTTNTFIERTVSSFGNSSSLLKYLSDGIFDLGNYVRDFKITIPYGVPDITSFQDIVLITNNYRYIFFLGNYTVIINKTSGDVCEHYSFLWNGSRWIVSK